MEKTVKEPLKIMKENRYNSMNASPTFVNSNEKILQVLSNMKSSGSINSS